ncbi:MAG: hypothetical protein AB1333_01275 [Patescibacteria group bacterium]
MKKEDEKEKGEVEELAEELNINLPSVGLPPSIKLIALFTLIGGLSIVGSLFADVVRPNAEGFGFYILRFIVGFLSLGTVHGMARKKRWALWFYGFIVIIGIFINPIISILPLGILIYLYKNRSLFEPSVFDKILTFFAFATKEAFKSKKL